MTHVASGGAEGFGELRRFYGGRGLEKQRGEDEGFEEVEIVGFQQMGCERVETTRCEGDAEHGTLLQEGFDAHKGVASLAIQLSPTILNYA